MESIHAVSHLYITLIDELDFGAVSLYISFYPCVYMYHMVKQIDELTDYNVKTHCSGHYQKR